MPKLRPEPRDPSNPDYGEFQKEGPSSLFLKCEECGVDELYATDREPVDPRDSVFIQMALRTAARRDGWKIHVQAILCPSCHLDLQIENGFRQTKLADEPGYIDLTDPNFKPGDTKFGSPS